jgi:hypothetical protein
VLKIPITYPVVTTLSINWSKINSGAAGEKGENGSSLYTWIKYSKVPNPSSEYEIFDDPTNMSYIGIAYNKTSEEVFGASISSEVCVFRIDTAAANGGCCPD